MSALLEAVQKELQQERDRHAAAVEQEDRRHAEALEPLEAIEQLAQKLDGVAPPSPRAARTPRRRGGGKKSSPNASPRREPRARPAAAAAGEGGLRQRSDQNALELLELLRRQGPMTTLELVEATGFSKSAVVRYTQKLLRGKPPAIKVVDHRAGSHGGRPQPVYASATEGGPSIDDAPPPEPPAKPAESAADKDRTERRKTEAEERDEQLRRELDEALGEGPKTLRQLHEELDFANRGVSRAAFTGRIQRLSGFERWGVDREGNDTWRRIPRPDEREDVEISHNDNGSGESIQGRILELLLIEGLTIPDLGDRLDERPAVVAQNVSLLEREGRVVKQPGGVYQRTGA